MSNTDESSNNDQTSSDLLYSFQSSVYLVSQNAGINVRYFFTFLWQSFVSLVLALHVSLLVSGLVVVPLFLMGRVCKKSEK